MQLYPLCCPCFNLLRDDALMPSLASQDNGGMPKVPWGGSKIFQVGGACLLMLGLPSVCIRKSGCLRGTPISEKHRIPSLPPCAAHTSVRCTHVYRPCSDASNQHMQTQPPAMPEAQSFWPCGLPSGDLDPDPFGPSRRRPVLPETHPAVGPSCRRSPTSLALRLCQHASRAQRGQEVCAHAWKTVCACPQGSCVAACCAWQAALHCTKQWHVFGRAAGDRVCQAALHHTAL